MFYNIGVSEEFLTVLISGVYKTQRSNMLNIIPQTKSYKMYGGDVAMERQPKIVCCEGAEFCDPMARKLFQNICPAIKPDFENEKVTVSFLKDPALPDEGYRIDANGDSVTVEASGAKGWTYALITLRQIMKADDEGKPFLLSCPCCHIEDAPRFAYRGFMLDEARNFLGEDVVKRVINLMSFYKLNVLHWHLSDDQGYRIESKLYPQLNRIASVRNDTQVGGFSSTKFAGCKHEGFYSQSQIKHIIAFAAERNIDVQPEIDLPGHISALTAAFPDISCSGESHSVPTTFGNFSGAFCPGSEKAWETVYSLLDEVCSVFESKYIHIGGDPFDFSDWKTCPACKKFMQENNLSDERALFAFTLNKIIDHLDKKGKIAIVRTSDFLNGIDKRAVLHLFKQVPQETIDKFVSEGRKFIVSPHQLCSFDHPYVMSPIKPLYAMEPLHYLGKNASDENVLGVEGLLWGEWIYDLLKVEFNCLPRLCALSETGWSPKDAKDFAKFTKHWQANRRILDLVNANWACDKLAKGGFIFKNRDIFIWKTADQYGEVRKNKK